MGNLSADLVLIYERASRTGQWSLRPYLRKIWRPENTSDWYRGLRLGVGSRLTPQDQLEISLVYEQRSYSSSA